MKVGYYHDAERRIVPERRRHRDGREADVADGFPHALCGRCARQRRRYHHRPTSPWRRRGSATRRTSPHEAMSLRRSAAASADDEVGAALKQMEGGTVRRLPVLDATSHLTGILSMTHIVLRALDETNGVSSAEFVKAPDGFRSQPAPRAGRQLLEHVRQQLAETDDNTSCTSCCRLSGVGMSVRPLTSLPWQGQNASHRAGDAFFRRRDACFGAAMGSRRNWRHELDNAKLAAHDVRSAGHDAVCSSSGIDCRPLP